MLVTVNKKKHMAWDGSHEPQITSWKKLVSWKILVLLMCQWNTSDLGHTLPG